MTLPLSHNRVNRSPALISGIFSASCPVKETRAVIHPVLSPSPVQHMQIAKSFRLILINWKQYFSGEHGRLTHANILLGLNEA
jgi:hypothetical protein